MREKNVDYVGIDLPPSANNIWGLEKPAPGLMIANAAHMPFPDNTFDYILMRSVFGQFTLHDCTDLDDVRLWGMYEGFRTLKPEGKIIVAEENTPWHNQYVEGYLQDAGFKVKEYIPTNTPEQVERWRATRSQFYGDRDNPRSLTYIMIAEKPIDPEYEEVSAELRRFRDFENEAKTVWTGIKWSKGKTKLISPITYKKGKENTDPSIIPPNFVW